ncbi:MAG: hypothetical protein J5875_12575, partial [Paludibacteraceae bacterium]|nr:hypothetical protein [Paludibacteraceae bacterium]
VYRNFLKDLSSREPPGTLPKGVGLYNPKADAKLDLFPELANYSGNYFKIFFKPIDLQSLKKIRYFSKTKKIGLIALRFYKKRDTPPKYIFCRESVSAKYNLHTYSFHTEKDMAFAFTKKMVHLRYDTQCKNNRTKTRRKVARERPFRDSQSGRG